MKLLLITDVPPCKEFSGSLLTEQLCRFIPEFEIDIFAVMNKDLQGINFTSDLKNTRIVKFDKPKENTGHLLPGKLGIIISFFYEWYIQFFISTNLVKKIVNAGAGRNYDYIWCILQGQTMIRIALPVANRFKARLLTQIWDHPSWWFKENKVNRYWRNRFMGIFHNTLKNSHHCGTASFAMSEMLKSLLSINSVPFIPGIDDVKLKKPAVMTNSKNIVIGMAGQLYSKSEWNSFLGTLDFLNWKINNKNIIVRVLGYHFEISGHRKVNIEFLGYRNQDETIEILSKCDLLYCPYFFDKKYEIISTTSFPSKLITYFAAGRPVFFHGPADSSPANFLIKSKAAFLCHSLDKRMIELKLKECLSNKKVYDQMAVNGNIAVKKYFTTEILKRNFFKFLDL